MTSTENYDFVIKNGTFVLPNPLNQESFVLQKTSVACRAGKIVAIGDQVQHKATNVFDANHLHVLPGVIDSQVHFREPGLTHKEDIETGTRGAVLGGVTSVFEMPNTTPSTTNKMEFEEKLRRAKDRSWSHISFFIGATPENIDDLPELEQLPHCCAIKIFMGSSTGSLLVEEDDVLERILAHGQRRVAVHAEDEQRLKERKNLALNSQHPRSHPVWRDELSALKATERLLRAARKTNRLVHVLHVTTAQEMTLLKQNLDLATVEVTPQHLTLTAPECYERLGTLAQMNPPIRDAQHQEALWAALRDGTVTVIGSDHAPHTLEEKSKPYPSSPSGMTGVQTLVPLMLNHVHLGNLDLFRMVELCSRNPARLYGATTKGAIAIGKDADFTIVDLKRKESISNKWIASRSAWTPFDGYQVQGWPMATVVGGRLAMSDGQTIGQPQGEFISFDL